MVLSSIPAVSELFSSMLYITVEPRYNEPLFNEVLGIANDFLYPSHSKIYEKEPASINETSL